MIKIEQRMENLHAELNSSENNRKNERNRAKSFFLMIKAQENKQRTDKRRFKKKLKQYPNGKQNK